MKKIFLILFTFSFFIKGYSQIEVRSYEQVAIDYFEKEIIKNNQDYSNIKYLIFNGEVDKKYSSCCSFCITLPKVPIDDSLVKDSKVNVPTGKIFVKKLNFFKKLFTSKNKIKKVYLYKSYPYKDNFAVVIQSSGKIVDDFFTVIIDKDSKEIIDTCKKSYVE